MRGMEQFKKKSRRGATAKNRYAAGAKLSEHKFLRILEGYAEGLPIQALEPTIHVSGKTIRGTYRTLRTHLPLAVQRERARFAGAGDVLFSGGGLSPEGNRLLSGIARTRRFARYVHRHAPRINSAEEERLLLVEKAVRVMCAVDLRGIEELFPEFTRAAEARARRIAQEVMAQQQPAQTDPAQLQQTIALAVMDATRPGWRNTVQTDGFQTWIAAQPEDYQQTYASTWDTAVFSGVLNDYLTQGRIDDILFESYLTE